MPHLPDFQSGSMFAAGVTPHRVSFRQEAAAWRKYWPVRRSVSASSSSPVGRKFPTVRVAARNFAAASRTNMAHPARSAAILWPVLGRRAQCLGSAPSFGRCHPPWCLRVLERTLWRKSQRPVRIASAERLYSRDCYGDEACERLRLAASSSMRRLPWRISSG